MARAQERIRQVRENISLLLQDKSQKVSPWKASTDLPLLRAIEYYAWSDEELGSDFKANVTEEQVEKAKSLLTEAGYGLLNPTPDDADRFLVATGYWENQRTMAKKLTSHIHSLPDHFYRRISGIRFENELPDQTKARKFVAISRLTSDDAIFHRAL